MVYNILYTVQAVKVLFYGCMRKLLAADDAMQGCKAAMTHDPYGKYLWTAGQRVDPNSESPFVWKLQSGMRSLTYENWYEGQPDFYPYTDGKESCLNIWPIHGYRWNDERCSYEFCFICEVSE